MKKIAILNCAKADRVCTGAACLSAWNARSKSFAVYEEPLELIAFAHCNGCEVSWQTDEGMLKKLERLEKEGAEVVHFGVCTKTHDGAECKTISEIADWLNARGIAVVRGTH